MTIYGEMNVSILEMQRVCEAYRKNCRPIEKSAEEKHDEEIKIKPGLPPECGNHVDLYV
jgi:hypothetical protein